MATRTQVRELVISILYAKDIGNNDIDSFIDEMLEEKKIRNKQKEFCLSLLNGTLDNLNKVDESLNNHLKEWKLDQISNIERSILRLGAYEVLFSDTDKAVVINESIELAKKLASGKTAKLVNGVLDAIDKS